MKIIKIQEKNKKQKKLISISFQGELSQFGRAHANMHEVICSIPIFSILVKVNVLCKLELFSVKHIYENLRLLFSRGHKNCNPLHSGSSLGCIA